MDILYNRATKSLKERHWEQKWGILFDYPYSNSFLTHPYQQGCHPSNTQMGLLLMPMYSAIALVWLAHHCLSMTFRFIDHQVSIYCASLGLVGEWDSHCLCASPMGLEKFIHHDGVGCARSWPGFSQWKQHWSAFKMLKSIRTPTACDGVELPIREVPLACCFFPTIQNLKDIVVLSILSIHPMYCTCESALQSHCSALSLPCPVCSTCPTLTVSHPTGITAQALAVYPLHHCHWLF